MSSTSKSFAGSRLPESHLAYKLPVGAKSLFLGSKSVIRANERNMIYHYDIYFTFFIYVLFFMFGFPITIMVVGWTAISLL